MIMAICNVLVVQSHTTDDMIEFKNELQSTEPKTQEPKNECLLKMSFPPEELHSLKVSGVDTCDHISFVTSGHILVSDIKNLVLTNTNGDKLYRLKNVHARTDVFSIVYGIHTVNSKGEIFYINRDYDIKKISDYKETTTFKRSKNSYWNHCVYCSPSTGDLLVGVSNSVTGMVDRYSQTGHLTQTIKYDKRGGTLYVKPHFITENKNGDVVVSDYTYDIFCSVGTVVVTDRGGRHRFSYKRLPSGHRIDPRGICTDSLSQILVCDVKSVKVLVIDKGGNFLRFLSLESLDICRPHSLRYDKNNDCLWVGSENNNKVCVCRYITPQKALTGQFNILSSFIRL